MPLEFPEPMLKLLEMSGGDRSRAIYIGDTKYDKECALGAGIRFGLALWGAVESKGFESSYVLHKPDDILDIIVSSQTVIRSDIYEL